MIEYLKINKKKFFTAFWISAGLMFIMISVFAIISDGFQSYFSDSLFYILLGSIGLGIFITILILILGLIHRAFENWVYGKKAALALMDLGFSSPFLGENNKWVLAAKSLRGLFNEFPATVIYNADNDNKVNVILHVDLDSDDEQVRKKVYKELFDIAKQSKIEFTFSGIQSKIKLRRKILNNPRTFIDELDKLSQFARREKLLPSTDREKMII